jgi:hypothetical protein
MIRQVLKILWRQKQSRAGIFIEQALVGIVLIPALVSVAEMVGKYRMAGLLEVEHTCVFECMSSGMTAEEHKAIRRNMYIIVEKLRSLPCVEAISQCCNLAPYLRDDEYYYQSFVTDSIRIDGRHFVAVTKVADRFAGTVFRPEMEEGCWLEDRPLPDGSAPVVITRQFADKAGWTQAVGKKFSEEGRVYTVTGVASGLKQLPFSPPPVARVLPFYLYKDEIWYVENIARIKPGSEQEFVDAFHREYQRLISDERAEPVIHDLSSFKSTWMSDSLVEIALQSILTVFLFLFAFIGTFGLYRMLSRKRLKEFALRIALGAEKKQLIRLVVFESLVITGLAILPGLGLSLLIYEYRAMHVAVVCVTVVLMVVFSYVSAWYPAWRVSKVNPAEALQYE